MDAIAMAAPTPVAVANGGGIGPEITDATLRILKEAGGRLDAFIRREPGGPAKVGNMLEAANGDGMKWSVISSRDVKGGPDPLPGSITFPSRRNRYASATGDAVIPPTQFLSLHGSIPAAGINRGRTDHLCKFHGKAGFSAIQGH